MDIEKMWAEFMQFPFPDSCVGEEIEGICLVSLDTYAAGCISTFIGSGQLDSECLNTLKKCVKSFLQIIPKLEGQSRQYFTHLCDISTAILQENSGV